MSMNNSAYKTEAELIAAINTARKDYCAPRKSGRGSQEALRRLRALEAIKAHRYGK